MSANILAHARAYVAAGLSVIPIAAGTKEPAARLLPRVFDETSGKTRASWRMYQDRLPTDDELVAWFATGDAGLGVVCGGISGGLVVLDIESVDLAARWHELASGLLDAAVLDTLPMVATGKGRHIWFRMAAPIGNRKLAVVERVVLAETRGAGGYILAPPTLHPSGVPYTLLAGDLHTVPVLAAADVQALLDAARALHAPAVPATSEQASGDVIGAFNQAHRIDAILEQHGYTPDGRGRYVRPGGERSSVQIVDGRAIHFNANDALYAPRPDGGHYGQTPFSAWCALEHAGDLRSAVRAAARLLGLAQEPPARQPHTPAGEEHPASWPYAIHDGEIWMDTLDRQGNTQTMWLCNFIAQITSETILDDGEHREELYTVVATCQQRTRTLEIKRTEFEGDGAVARIVAALGARARVNPRTQIRYIIDAIKACSTTVVERLLFTHTGWVGQRFLLANGYVDRDGWHPSTDCQLPRRLQQYSLAGDDAPLATALARFDELLELAPASVMVPLLGGVLLGPVIDSVDAAAPMIHLYGPTGCHKTSISCAAMALWGDFTPSQPTDTWTSTSNSVQRLGWHLKNAPMLLDDYKAANVKPQQVTFLLQNYGDNMARGRLDANSDLRNTFPMRCVLISSGEDQPDGEASTLARILSVQLARRMVDRVRLTNIQEHARELHPLTVAYLRWLAAETLADNRALHQQTRTAFLAQLEGTSDDATNPGRIASNVAVLYVAWETFGRFLDAGGHWPSERVRSWLTTCKRELFALARAQLHLTTQERYSQLFLETVRALVASGRAVLLSPETGLPEPGQVLLGSRDSNGTYLIAQAAYDEVCRHMRAAGRPVGFSLRALSQLFQQDGLLQSVEPPSLVIKKRINGSRPCCWHLPPDLLDQ